MTYNTLVAPKGAAGSIANWVAYTKLDLVTIIDEAQSLLFQMLRVREMRTEWTFGLAVGQCQIALPSRFLDPIGRLFDITNGMGMPHKIESDILSARTYEPVTGGNLGSFPFTTTIGSSLVLVYLPGIDLNQGGTITISNAGEPLGNINFNGTFPIADRIDIDRIVIDVDVLSDITGTQGGEAATYTANNLIAGSPSRWAIWDEQVKFDTALATATQYKQLYYRSPLPLSPANQSNWLTNRYPVMMRKACQAAAADFMKDDIEYKKGVESLSALIQSTAAENDLIYRGAEFGTDTP